MFKVRSTQLAAAVLASGFFALALGARAESGAYSLETKPAGSAVVCERARLSAWFESQRSLTDGGSTSVQEAATPRECAAAYGANATQTAPDKKRVAAANASQRSFAGSFEGILGGQ